MGKTTGNAPASLGDAGRAKWAELYPRLLNPSPSALTLLEVYCSSYERWARAQKWLADHGDVLELVSDKGIVLKAQPAPKLDVAARCERAMNEALAGLRRLGETAL